MCSTSSLRSQHITSETTTFSSSSSNVCLTPPGRYGYRGKRNSHRRPSEVCFLNSHPSLSWTSTSPIPHNRDAPNEYDLEGVNPLLNLRDLDNDFPQDRLPGLIHEVSLDSNATADLDLWEGMPRKNLTLTQLKQLDARSDKDTLVRQMTRRTTLTIDRQAIVHPDLGAHSMPSPSIDFLLLVPKATGLHVLLPPPGVPVPNSWSFKLNLSNPARTLRMKRGMLGFDPCGNTLHIGQINESSVWCCLVPEDFVDPAVTNYKPVPANTPVVGIPVNRERLRKLQMFFMYAMDRARIKGVNLPEDERYSINLTDSDPGWANIGWNFR